MKIIYYIGARLLYGYLASGEIFKNMLQLKHLHIVCKYIQT